MSLRNRLVSLVLIGLSVGVAWSEDKKELPARLRGNLPRSWSKLGLTDQQKHQIYGIQAEYQAKIDDLKQQIDKLRKEELASEEKVLTEAQRARLQELPHADHSAGSEMADKEKNGKDSQKGTTAPDKK